MATEKLDKTKVLMTTCSLMMVERPALSDNRSWKTLFGLFESGRFT